MTANAGYHAYATGDVLTAAQVQFNLQNQTLMYFATAGARTTALSGVLVEGMITYIPANGVEYYNGSVWIALAAGDAAPAGTLTGTTLASNVVNSSLTSFGTAPTLASVTNGGTVTIPSGADTLVARTSTDTLTNKTLTAPKINLAFNAQTGTTYTLVAADSGKLVTSSNASAVVITIPASVFAAGEQINVQSIGVGLTTISGGAVTITSTGASTIAPILRARYSACTIICTASNVFTVIGDLS